MGTELATEQTSRIAMPSPMGTMPQGLRHRAQPGDSNRVHGQTGQVIRQYSDPAGISHQEWQKTMLGKGTFVAQLRAGMGAQG